MTYFRLKYTNAYGEQKESPFSFDNIEEARRARTLYGNRGYTDISITVYTTEN